MPLPVLPGVLRCSVGGSITGGSRWSNTWHFRRTDLATPTEAQVNSLHTLLMNFYGGHILSQAPAPTTLATGNYTPLDGTSGAFVLAAGLVGSGGSDALPAETSAVLTIRTAARGRQNRGRIFLPAMGESVSDSNGHLIASVQADIIGGVTTLVSAGEAAGWELGVASYGVSRLIDHTVTPKRIVVRTWDPHFTLMTSVTMDLIFDVIRNRKA